MGGRKCDLGNGVSVDDSLDVGPVVTSVEIALPWRPRAGQFAGTAVFWRDHLYEALQVDRADGIERWHFVPWPEEEVLRNIETLDSERVRALAVEPVALKRSRGIRMALVLLSPLAGLMPASIQNRWERDHNVPGSRATVFSAVGELAFGMWWIVNPGPILLRLLGWILFSEGLVRLWFGMTQGEPMGSFLTAPIGRLPGSRPKTTVTKAERVEVIQWNHGEPNMTLAMSAPRTDWVVDGVIRFRGSLYRLIDTKAGGDKMAYFFEAVPAETPVTISLVPPKADQRRRDRGSGFLADAGRFILLAFAPRRFQEQLVPDLNLGIRTLTWISAGLELFGGSVNLMGSASRDVWIGIDLVVALEGAWRLVRAAATGLPVGSVFGLPFIAVYERWAHDQTIDDD